MNWLNEGHCSGNFPFKKGEFPEQWPFVFIMQTNLWKYMRGQLQRSQFALCSVCCKSTQAIAIFFCWDSLNDRWVTMNTPINTMHSQCFANGQLEIICLHWIYRLTFSYDHLSRLKNKPVRLSRQALHYCEMKSHIILKTEFSLNIVARNLIQRTVNVYFSAVLSLSNQLNVLESFYFSSSCHLYG